MDIYKAITYPHTHFFSLLFNKNINVSLLGNVMNINTHRHRCLECCLGVHFCQSLFSISAQTLLTHLQVTPIKSKFPFFFEKKKVRSVSSLSLSLFLSSLKRTERNINMDI